MVDAFGCIVFTAPLVNFFLTSLTVCSFLAGECGCLWLGICFVFYRAVSRVKRWEGDNCGAGVSKGLEVGGFGELG